MAVDEIIAEVRTLPPEDLRRLRRAIDARLSGSEATEAEFEAEMERRGLLIRPTPGPAPALDVELPVEIDGEPLSEQLLRERR